MSARRIQALGDSPFNYALHTYNEQRFIQYFQQIQHVLALQPARVLEVGPGDHTVTDFLLRKGIAVETVDVEEALHPDHIGDIRRPLPVQPVFDVVLACEVLEHLDFRWFTTAIDNLLNAARPGGHVVISVPYVTLRIFPPDGRDGAVVSSSGRLLTGIPLGRVLPLLRGLRFFYKLATGAGWKGATAHYGLPEGLGEEDYAAHHWEVGWGKTTRTVVRRILQDRYDLRLERAYLNSNTIFYVIRRPVG